MVRRSSNDRQHEVTGRTVLLLFVAFFGIVFAVNAIMVHAATSTFGGAETGSAYKTGLAFRQEAEAARAQKARGWQVEANLSRKSPDEVSIVATVRDSAGGSPERLSAVARLAHPADGRRDKTVFLTETSGGRFTGSAEIAPGQWDIIIDFTREGERVFRSKSRVMVR
jgi:nitrogen fixation protein FixH